MKTYRFSALAAAGLMAGGLGATSVSAADFGGNCCADLEERIAELEATTARKGNRKVSLTISGWVAEQVMWFDDGVEDNVYVSGIGRTLQSNVKFTGQAVISPGWSAGYVLHVELGTVDSFGLSAETDDPPDNINNPFLGIRDTDRGVYALQSYWFMKSEHMGKLSIGKQSQASDNTAILVDGSGSLVPANWVMFDGASFALNGGPFVGGVWGNLGHCHFINDTIAADCNGITENVVRYDSPSFWGFSVSASWGEDDMWDVAARYAAEWSGFKFAAAVSYAENRDENLAINLVDPVDVNNPLDDQIEIDRKDVSYFQAGLYMEHIPSGLWLYGAFGKEEVDTLYNPLFFGGPDDPNNYDDGHHWYVKGGIRQRWTPLGHTILYGEYGRNKDTYSPALASVGVTGSKFERYGAGIVQEIDAAAMSIWLAYRHYEGRVTCTDQGEEVGQCFDVAESTGESRRFNFDDVDLVKFGALINF